MSLSSFADRFFPKSKSKSQRKSRRSAPRSAPALDPLEPRTLLSVVIAPNGKSATFTDTDADLVTVAITKGTLTDANFTTVPSGLGDQLQTIDLSTGGFDGSNLTVTVKKPFAGDGHVNIGYVNSTGHNLGAVTIPGDLGRITAGSGALNTPGIAKLSVGSIGVQGLATQDNAGSLSSNINGALTSLTTTGDIQTASIHLTKITSLTIGGSLIGDIANNSGSIVADGNIGTVKVGGSIQGGDGSEAGSIIAHGTMGAITILGDIIGGGGDLSAAVFADDDVGLAKVTGDIRGGTNTEAGTIGSNFGKFAGITLGGSLIGGSAERAGHIEAGTTIGPVKITGDVTGGDGDFSGYISSGGLITSIYVGGSVTGGSGPESAFITSSQNIGPVTIIHDLIGGDGVESGEVAPIGNLGPVTIGGFLTGGAGGNSGSIDIGGTLAKVTVTKDVTGGAGSFSGSILDAAGKITSVILKANLVGGAGHSSGIISTNSDLGSVTIAGDFIGGSISGATSLDYTGVIFAAGKITAITINGSIIAGTNSGSGTLTHSATIGAGNDIGSLTVKHNIVGNNTGGKLSQVSIIARGQAHPTATANVAIGKITVSGNVNYALILAGYDDTLTPVNADAQIGAVAISGNLGQTSIVAGASNTASTNTFFGNGNDAKITGVAVSDSPKILSKITSITIGGTISGTPGGTDAFGFVAEQVVSVKIGPAKKSLTPTAHTDNLALGLDGDFNVHEI